MALWVCALCGRPARGSVYPLCDECAELVNGPVVSGERTDERSGQ